MRVKELAQQLGIRTEVILEQLKALRLKAKGPEQELNAAVLVVLKSELQKLPKEKVEERPKKDVKAIVEETEGLDKDKKSGKKTPAKTARKVKKTKKEEPSATEKKTKKKTVKQSKKTVGKKKETIKKEKPKAVAKKKEPSKKTSSKKEKKDVLKLKTTVIRRPKKSVSKRKTAVEESGEKPSGSLVENGFTTTEAKPSSQELTLPKDTEKEKTPDQELPTIIQEEISKEGLVEEKKEMKPEKGELEVQVPISVKDLAVRLQEKPSVLLKKLMQRGVMAHINQNLDEEIVKRILAEFGYQLARVKSEEENIIEIHQEQEEDPALLKPRAPVVTFMGHVDHGKTTLLDYIRKSKIADQEHGGITQHIGAYSVRLPRGQITFLDTPGHEAFTAMRARGAHITDLVVVVVAADEGVMPQTDEAIDHARAAEVPIVVALTKIDKRNADPDKVKKQLAERDLSPEDWGGKTVVVPVSGVTGEGVEELLEMILLEAELLELKANPNKKASGIVVEAQLTHGRGPVATVIVQNGTLREGDALIVGPYYAKVKAMLNDHQKPIKEAGPAMPVEILGLSGVPDAGEKFYVVDDERTARSIALRRQERLKVEKLQASQRITLEDVYSQIQQGKIKEVNIILKADVQGSLEALKEALLKLPTDEVKLKFIHTGVGVVNASDVILAAASNAIIIAFNVGIGPRAKEELEKVDVDVRQYRIIYDAINDMRKALEGLLEPRKRKIFVGRIEVRNVFKLSKAGIVAGCVVTKGRVHRKVNIDVVRNGEIIHSGKILSLKRFKDDVREVGEGYECGIVLEKFDAIQVGDILEAYEVETIVRKLE